jgi:small conductance mechanosensitive channel
MALPIPLVWIEVLGLVVGPAIAGPLISRWLSRRGRARGAPPPRVRAIDVLSTAVWVAIVAVGISLTLGSVSFLSTLTFTAIAGVALTLALQTTLQNLVSGVILLRNRSIHIGDSVQFSGLKGIVAGIGPVTTVIKLTDGNLAFVSNSNLLSGPLVNYTAAKRFEGEY